MEFTVQGLYASAFYLIVLINPISKVFFLAAAEDATKVREVRAVSAKASLVAFLILFSFILLGNIIFTQIFHVDLFSFQILGGLILFTLGYRALTKGVFYESEEHHTLAGQTVVPLASPLIAGPATITAVIALTAQDGVLITSFATLIAIAVNFVVMLSSIGLYKLLKHYNLVGALIRLTGLIVSTISVQMILTGISAWYATIK
jgi:multiple antibiotic resistance protein